MKLHPKDFAEIKRIIGLEQPLTTDPATWVSQKLMWITKIMEVYNLNPNDALACAGRLIRISPDELGNNLAVDQRSIETLAGICELEELPEGRVRWGLPSEQPLEKFQQRPRWRPQDAIEMKRLMTRFYESAFGLVMANEAVERAGWDPKYTHKAALSSRSFWAQEDLLLIFAKDSYLDMLEAASITAPTGELNDDELLAPSGVLFLENERNIHVLAVATDDIPIRAVAWRVMDGFLRLQVLVDGHHARDNLTEAEPPADCYAYLDEWVIFNAPMRNPVIPGNEENVNALLGYLRSIKAIAQSPVTESLEVQSKLRSKKKRGKPAQRRQPIVRVLSLRNANHGRYELDAATGRKMRQHWVRGHWRNQWYPSLEDNRAIWIDGYIKGDVSLGTVTGQKVHVAR